MTTIKQALEKAALRLKPHEEARLDAEVLLCHALQASRAFLYAHSEDKLSPALDDAFGALIEARQAGQPIAYLTGVKEFWSLPLSVNPSTLIPRPETELLVETTLQLAPKETIDLLELGTGSGAISIALAHSRPHWRFTATDISDLALQTAQANAKELALTQIEFLNSDWFEDLPLKHVDMIVSNPPYIEENDPHLNQGDLRFEPQNALASGPDGLNALRSIICGATHFLKPQGFLLLEHGYQQAEAVKTLLEAQQFQKITCHLDLQGHPRVTSAQVR